MKLAGAADCIAKGVEETLQYFQFSSEHWRSLRTNNPLECGMREIRRRTRAVGAFPDGNSALILVSSRLRHIVGNQWGRKRYMDMTHIKDLAAAPAAPNNLVAGQFA
jgi:putative transposase